MRKYLMNNYWLCCVSVLLFAGCKQWIDVKPVNEMTSTQVFSDEKTVGEALNGVYMAMTANAGYGKEATWGFVDVLGGIYESSKLQTYEVSALSGDFGNNSARQVIEGIWNMAYSGIANANNLLEGIEEADPAIFTGNKGDLYRGEALALRALLHFDVLRLFGPAVNTAGWSDPILPYVRAYSSNVTSRISGPQYVTHLLEDLASAEQLLGKDPILENLSQDDFRARQVRLNYYGVKALQARVNLWAGDRPAAAAAAQAVIDAVPDKFPWTLPSNISSGASFNFIVAGENVFSLFVPTLQSAIEGKLINIPPVGATSNFQPHYGITDQIRQQVYETSGPGTTDYRQIYMVGIENLPLSSTYLYKKLHQSGPANANPYDYARNRVPMIKTAELFYIAAECVAETDPAQAVDYLNTVRTARGISVNLPASLNSTQVLAEIRKEYLKEFPCEGQVFYYKKRTGETNRILPLPQRELDFGQ